jgi:indole-3-glycerol phosphate synthase
MKFDFNRITEEKIRENEELSENRSLIAGIEKALREGKTPIIAEAKTASPQSGKISDIEPEDAAKLLEEGGACAISILTDQHFDGKICHLRRTKQQTKIPVLRKDFIVEEFQLYESCGNGANAVLLIASLLKEKTKNFVNKAHALGMEALVEIHNEEDMKYALATDAKLIGINNRDLKTLETELGTTERLAPKIPKNKIIVSESGIKTREDIIRLKKAGAKAFLIGTGIMSEKDIKEKTRELVQ